MSRVRLPVAGVVAGAAVVPLAAADGGYFPTAWGWAALVPLLAAAAAIALRERVELERLDALWLAALAGLAVWTGLSAAWSAAPAPPLLELERALVYVAVALALLLLARRETVPGLVAGTLAGIAAVGAYALATRLAPDRIGTFDPAAGYQLAEPIGYWNALGVMAVLGILLALGAATATARPVLRAAAALPLPLLACTLLFTFSRGAWVALALGLVVLAALHPARLRLAVVALALAPLPAFGVWLGGRSEALTESGATLDAAARDGHRLAGWLLVLTVLEALVAAGSPRIEPRVTLGHRGQQAVLAGLGLAAIGACALLLSLVGTPQAALDRAADAFTSPVAQTDDGLERRLFSASGNGRSDYWRVALEQARDNPLLGAGAGSYGRRWVRDRPTAFDAQDAHSLYVETLAELGPVGLALLLAALGVPLVALARVRREPLAVAAGAAYCAFLVHAGLDWDWEVPAVTVPALLLAGAVVVLARRGTATRLGTWARAGTLAAVAVALAFVFVIHAGNTALAASEAALERGDTARAEEEARSARRWQPWSAAPWQRLAEAQLLAGRPAAARASYREALERDETDWSLWFGLAALSRGAEREQALARAQELNPHSPEIADLRQSG